MYFNKPVTSLMNKKFNDSLSETCHGKVSYKVVCVARFVTMTLIYYSAEEDRPVSLSSITVWLHREFQVRQSCTV